jgi:hypothetical protein
MQPGELPGRAAGLRDRLCPPQCHHRAREAGLKVQDHHLVRTHRDAAHPEVRRQRPDIGLAPLPAQIAHGRLRILGDHPPGSR